VALTGVWSFVLLQRSPDWQQWFGPLVLLGGLAVAALIGALPGLRRAEVTAVVAAALVVALIGPAAYALDTAATPHSGAIPSAGPAAGVGFGRGAGRGGFGPGAGGGFGGQGPVPSAARARAASAARARATSAAVAASAGCSTPARQAPSWSPCSSGTARTTPGSRQP
jgi:hypothetical protein